MSALEGPTARPAVRPVYFKYRDLVTLDACEERLRFRDVFGEKPVLVTVTTAVANADKGFNWFWMAESALNTENLVTFRRRMNEASNGDLCTCEECDPHGAMKRLIAQTFTECFLAQDGMAGRRPWRKLFV